MKKTLITGNTFTPPHPLKTAVLFLIFNRPDTTKQVFEAIRRAKTPKLYVAADGPRADRSGEIEKVKQVRRIATKVDWDCDVKTLFHEKNFGCRVAVSSAIDWFFENEEEGIILEDDCLPSQSFFRFCEELLEKYRDDERIGIIAGTNYLSGRMRTDNSYYFSRYTHVWGWASWRRSWNRYDACLKIWPEIKESGWLDDIFYGDKKLINYWAKKIDKVYTGKIDTWDYQFAFSNFIHSALNVMPATNLISNIGCGQDATHTTSISSYSEMPIEGIEFPLFHPKYIIRDSRADAITEQGHYSFNSLPIRICHKLKRCFAAVLNFVVPHKHL